MKRNTAIRIALEVATRIQERGGIIDTPDCQFAQMRVHSLWLFGSTLTGKSNPRDVDLLVDWEPVGEPRSAKRGEVPPDKKQLRDYGILIARSSQIAAIRTLSGKSKMVRIHRKEIDGDIAFQQARMLWPEMEFDPAEILPEIPKSKILQPGKPT